MHREIILINFLLSLTAMTIHRRYMGRNVLTLVVAPMQVISDVIQTVW